MLCVHGRCVQMIGLAVSQLAVEADVSQQPHLTPHPNPTRSQPPDLLNNRPIAQRTLVISAGVIANIIFAFSVLFAQVSTIGKAESDYLVGVKVPEVISGGVAERAGIRAGDVLLRVGEYEVKAAPDQVSSRFGSGDGRSV